MSCNVPFPFELEAPSLNDSRDDSSRHVVQCSAVATHETRVQCTHVERTELFPYVDHDFHVSARCSRCGHSSHAHEGQGCLNCLCVAFLPVEPARFVAEDRT